MKDVLTCPNCGGNLSRDAHSLSDPYSCDTCGLVRELTGEEYLPDQPENENPTKENIMKSKAFTLIELLVVISILAILGALAMGGIGGCSVSEGSRSGVITKVSDAKGIFFKTCEVHMQVGGGVQGTAAESWDFTIPSRDYELKRKAHQAEESGHRVKVSYRQKFFIMPTQAETNYWCADIKDLQESPASGNPTTFQAPVLDGTTGLAPL